MHLELALFGVHAFTEPLHSKLRLVALTSAEVQDLFLHTLSTSFVQRPAEPHRKTNLVAMLRKAAAEAYDPIRAVCPGRSRSRRSRTT